MLSQVVYITNKMENRAYWRYYFGVLAYRYLSEFYVHHELNDLKLGQGWLVHIPYSVGASAARTQLLIKGGAMPSLPCHLS